MWGRGVYAHIWIHIYIYIYIHIHIHIYIKRASLVAQIVKNLPAMQEIQVQSLDQEDPLEKGITTQSSIPAWRIPWTEEPGGLQSVGSQKESQTTEQLNMSMVHNIYINPRKKQKQAHRHRKQINGYQRRDRNVVGQIMCMGLID